MIIRIPDVLTAAQVAEARAVLDKAEWVDGRVTAGHQSAQAKDNMQIPEGSPAAQQLGDMILAALGTNPLFLSAALPLRVFPPLFNRYSGGQSFGTHVDNAIRQVAGHAASHPHRSVRDALPRRARGIRRRRALRGGHLRRAQREAARRPHGALSVHQPAPRHARSRAARGSARSSGFKA